MPLHKIFKCCFKWASQIRCSAFYCSGEKSCAPVNKEIKIKKNEERGKKKEEEKRKKENKRKKKKDRKTQRRTPSPPPPQSRRSAGAAPAPLPRSGSAAARLPDVACSAPSPARLLEARREPLLQHPVRFLTCWKQNPF